MIFRAISQSSGVVILMFFSSPATAFRGMCSKATISHGLLLALAASPAARLPVALRPLTKQSP
jgi:hypothetical protein